MSIVVSTCLNVSACFEIWQMDARAAKRILPVLDKMSCQTPKNIMIDF